MARRSNRHLLALNGVLVVGLALVTFAPGAEGRQTVPSRSRASGQYAIISVAFQGATDRAMFILDAANEELIGMRWDRSRRSLDGIGYRDLKTDAELAALRQGR